MDELEESKKEELLSYIKSQQEKGVSLDEIKSTLMAQGGWSTEDLNKLLAQFNPTQQNNEPSPVNANAVKEKPVVEEKSNDGSQKPVSKIAEIKKKYKAMIIVVLLVIIGGTAYISFNLFSSLQYVSNAALEEPIQGEEIVRENNTEATEDSLNEYATNLKQIRFSRNGLNTSENIVIYLDAQHQLYIYGLYADGLVRELGKESGTKFYKNKYSSSCEADSSGDIDHCYTPSETDVFNISNTGLITGNTIGEGSVIVQNGDIKNTIGIQVVSPDED